MSNSRPLTVWILADQLTHRWDEWLRQMRLTPAQARVLMVESTGSLRRRPWHRHKLILVLSAMRHFADQLRSQGWEVDYRSAPDFRRALHDHHQRYQPQRWLVMRPATWQGAQFVESLRTALPLEVLPNRMFLATPEDLGAARSPLLEQFYRRMRRRTGLLMDGDQPAGGRWNFDSDNRLPPRKEWRKGDLRDVPQLPTFPPDAITQQVIAEVARIETAWGRLEGFTLPVTRADAIRFFDDFVAHRLARFGPYEDAMVSGAPVLFHSLVSPLINIGLLERDELCAAAERAWHEGHAPLQSVEAFIRQLIGWREFIYAIYWREMPRLREMNALQATRPLPRFYWDAQTEMACLREAVQGVWERGYTHHIQRLMILSNFAMLAGVRPQELNDWFLSTYVDAYDWVVTPNVIGMGTFADGGIVGTKPYAASANYIQKMSTYCLGCRYNPRLRVGKDACPFNALYWDFVVRHAQVLESNPRTAMPVKALRGMTSEQVRELRQQAARFLDKLD